MSFEANGVHVRAKQSCGCVWDLGVIQSPLMSARSSDGFLCGNRLPFFTTTFAGFKKWSAQANKEWTL